MASNVEITLKAIDNATKTLNGVEKEIKDVETAAGKGKIGIKNFGGAMGDTVQAATGFSMSQIGVAAAIGATAKVISDSIKDTVEYAAAVRELNQINGQSSESNSRLIQITDDLALSMESLNMATTAAARQGIALSVSELQRMSAEFLALENPVDRNTYALENFGRSGLEMIRVLEVGPEVLGRMNDATSDMLVLTDEQVQAARELEIAQDNLNDTWEGIKVSLGTVAIPALATFLDLMNEGIGVATELTNRQKTLSGVYKDHSTEVAKTTTSYDDYVAEMTRAYEVSGRMVIRAGDTIGVYEVIGDQLINVTDQYGILTEAEYANIGAMNEHIIATDGLQLSTKDAALYTQKLAEETAKAAEETAQKTEEYNIRMAAMKEANDALRLSAIEARTEQLNLAMALENMTDPTDIAKQQIELLNEAMMADPENANIYQQQIEAIAISSGLASENTIAFSNAVGVLPQLLAAGVIDDYATAWREMSEYIETDATPTFGELIEAFETAGLTSKTQAEIINDGMKLDPAIEESGRLYANLSQIANAPLTREFTYTVHVRTTGPIGLITGGGGGGGNVTPGGGGYEGGGPMGIGYASGGSFVIPPGFANDSYYLGAGHYGQSGEVVTVTPPNQAPAQRSDQSTELLAALLAEIRNQPRSIALAVEQAMQRISA